MARLCLGQFSTAVEALEMDIARAPEGRARGNMRRKTPEPAADAVSPSFRIVMDRLACNKLHGATNKATCTPSGRLGAPGRAR